MRTTFRKTLLIFGALRTGALSLHGRRDKRSGAKFLKYSVRKKNPQDGAAAATTAVLNARESITVDKYRLHRRGFSYTVGRESDRDYIIIIQIISTVLPRTGLRRHQRRRRCSSDLRRLLR